MVYSMPCVLKLPRNFRNYKKQHSVTLLLVSTVEAIDERVLPPSISSSENALDIPESVDTESTAAGPENTLVAFDDDG